MVVPPVVPRRGRTMASGMVIGVSGKSGNWPEDWRIHKEGESVMRGFRRNSLVLVQKIKPKA